MAGNRRTAILRYLLLNRSELKSERTDAWSQALSGASVAHANKGKPRNSAIYWTIPP